jgi:NhaA family Na+:H+ antiporter
MNLPINPPTGPAGRAAILLVRPFQRFFAQEASSSVLLLFCTAVAMLWANSPFADSYEHLWETYVSVGWGDATLSLTLHHWINDGLMAIFFFVIGLEIKREALVGELSTASKAALPIAAAIGGMVVPALIYVAFNAGTPALRGWGVPMATDIAFALGVLALLGSRVPSALRVFLAALAIADDLGAVLVIALFYTDQLSMQSLAAAAILLLTMFLLNRAGARSPIPYAVVGIALWFAVLQSGIHATVAGVLAATAIPARRRIIPAVFNERSEELLLEFREDLGAERSDLTPDQRDALYSLSLAIEAVETPAARLEHALHPWVSYFIMPVFALANAGVHLGGEVGSAMLSPVALGVALGLLLGKPIGVTFFAWLAVRIGWASLPADARWRHIGGVATLCGIGFTMSLFIANLAFPDPASLDVAKIGILTGSLLAGIAGWLMLARARVPDLSGPQA